MRFFTVARDKTYSVLLLISRLYIFDNIPSFWFKKPNFLPPNPASGCWALFNASVNSSYLKCLSFFIQLLLSFLFLPRSLAAITRRTPYLLSLSPIITQCFPILSCHSHWLLNLPSATILSCGVPLLPLGTVTVFMSYCFLYQWPHRFLCSRYSRFRYS